MYKKTGVKYGIDYIDPWVHVFPGSEKIFSRHWLSTQLAKILEPIAVRSVALVTGVSESYFKPVFDRNPHLKNQALAAAMPYGLEEEDYTTVERLHLNPYLFKRTGKTIIVYAGALLPKSFLLLEQIFKSIFYKQEEFSDVEFHFIGTGIMSNNDCFHSVKPIADRYGLWETIVFEHPNRIPYLDVLAHLSAANGIFILGSTEPHYSPSKLFLALLSKKPIFSILHHESHALEIMTASNACVPLSFSDETIDGIFPDTFLNTWRSYRHFMNNFDASFIPKSVFSDFSARAMTKILVENINIVCSEEFTKY